jgi:chromosome partitioning protein
MAKEPERFADLFNHPTVEDMYVLTPREFEHFVAYVLRRAGYDARVVGPHFVRGVDIEVRVPGMTRIFGGVECKQFMPGHRVVTAAEVRGVRRAPAVVRRGAKPLVVTTSDFTDAAYQMANAGKRRVYLINGPQLVRYITYVRGSRRSDENTITSLSPEFFAGKSSAYIRPRGGATILTIGNNKGGVGKTTTAYYLGAEFARQGRRVLLVDLDEQANLTERCLPERVAILHEEGDRFPNIADYFTGEQALGDLITSAETISGLGLIPSDPRLTLPDLGGSGRPDVELRFVRDMQQLSTQPLAPLGGVPEWIIIDTPPAMSVFTRAAVAAAHYLLAPVRPRPSSETGTRKVLSSLQTMAALVGGSTECLGAVVTHWDNLKVSEQTVALTIRPALRDVGADILSTKIPVDNQLEYLEPGAKTKGAQAYEALATEVGRYVESRSDRQEQAGASSHVNILRREE